MNHMIYDGMITRIAKALSKGDGFRREELRSEMHIALTAIIGEVDDDFLEKVLTLVAEAYLHGKVLR